MGNNVRFSLIGYNDCLQFFSNLSTIQLYLVWLLHYSLTVIVGLPYGTKIGDPECWAFPLGHDFPIWDP